MLSKDRITAGDGVKAHELKDKGRLSTQTNCAIFNYLNAIGIQTHFISEDKNNPSGFVAKGKSFLIFFLFFLLKLIKQNFIFKIRMCYDSNRMGFKV